MLGTLEPTVTGYREVSGFRFQIFERGENILELRPDPVVDLDKLPSHDTFHVDDEGSWVRHRTPFAFIGIVDAVAIDHPVVRI